ncbi:hypothetical protein GYMLUDRAFT_682899 [Collybiopsis luxurians FD-317 M1]|uniref:Uncharacterized protein n=1 Tax=Collybiopsis luxurians FD-317 M1 TaxID=944289 RepID=A0A0D0CKV7_9AGAR|nr:hypothetical protein GYMLUDRAFT_682899 [Collybiopsis luxurians FD-317 M1]
MKMDMLATLLPLLFQRTENYTLIRTYAISASDYWHVDQVSFVKKIMAAAQALRSQSTHYYFGALRLETF